MYFSIKKTLVSFFAFVISTSMIAMGIELIQVNHVHPKVDNLSTSGDVSVRTMIAASIIDIDVEHFITCLNTHDYKGAKNILEMRRFIAYRRDSNGNIPLHIAVRNKNPMAIELLLEDDNYNTSTFISNAQGDTALTMLVKSSLYLRKNGIGLSSVALHRQLIETVGSKCTEQEIRKNIELTQRLCDSNGFMKLVIEVSTLMPLLALVKEKESKIEVLNPIAENNKRKQDSIQLKQNNAKKYKGFTYGLVSVMDEDNQNRSELSNENILPFNTKRLRKSSNRISC